MHEVGQADPYASFDPQVLSWQGFVTGSRGALPRERMRDRVNGLFTFWMSLLQSCGVETQIRRDSHRR
jgi:hypothetical protein